METIIGEVLLHIGSRGVVPCVGHEGVPPTNSPIMAIQIKVHLQSLAGCELEDFVGLQVHCAHGRMQL